MSINSRYLGYGMRMQWIMVAVVAFLLIACSRNVSTNTNIKSGTSVATTVSNNTNRAIAVNPIVPGKVIHRGIKYGMVRSPYTSRVWLDRNLGASRVCQSITDQDCYGDYYQFGRNADGHEKRNSATTSKLIVSLNIVSDKFVLSYGTDWLDPAWDSDGRDRSARWSVLDGSSVCPVGFRVPTSAEFRAEINGNITNATEAFKSFFKFGLAGLRQAVPVVHGAITDEGSYSYMWSTSTAYSIPFSLFINNRFVNPAASFLYVLGASIRCIKA